MKAFSKVLAVLSVGALAAATAAHAADPATIRLGTVQPFSGSLAVYGHDTQPVIEYLVGKINAQGGIKSMGGAKIQIVSADDAGKPGQTAAEARRLITEEKASVLLGTLLTNHSLALSPVLDEYKVPTLALFGAGSKSPYLFSLGLPYERGYAKSMVDFLDYLREKGHPIKRVVTAYSNYEGAQQVNLAITALLKERGYELVGDVPLDMKATDLLPAMLKIRSLKPDAVLGIRLRPEAVKLQRARYDLNYYEGAFIEATGGADPAFWADLGDDVAQKALLNNTFALSLYSPAALATAREMAAEMDKGGKLNDKFGQFAVTAAQAVLVIKNALEKAGSTDPEKLRQAIAAVDLPLGHPDMVLPRSAGVSFADDRLVKDGSTLVVQWTKDRTTEVVYPSKFASTTPRVSR